MWLHEAPDLGKGGARKWRSYLRFCVKRFLYVLTALSSQDNAQPGTQFIPALGPEMSKTALAVVLCRNVQYNRYGVLCCVTKEVRPREE